VKGAHSSPQKSSSVRHVERGVGSKSVNSIGKAVVKNLAIDNICVNN
jgi:hypothetical protein